MKTEGKTVWITGASSGIGEAVAKEFFRHGDTVILSARNVKLLEEKKAMFDAVDPKRSVILPFDITSREDIERAVEKARKILTQVDILVNNAGVSQRSYAIDTDLAVDRDLFEVNFFGPVTLTKAILPWMIEKGGGHIAVISSMAGKYGFRMRTSYSASKHALHGFFESLRAELSSKNINVTLICPGRINTEISVHSLTGDGNLYGKMDQGQLNGVPVDKCARKIYSSVIKNRKEIFIGKGEILLLLIKRAFPWLFYKLVNRVSPV
jgi:dehydrogenase/reductase SDR family member 7B